MASIQNVSLKALKSGFGRNENGFQANIYLGKKKIGFVLDEGNGGALKIDIMDKQEEFEQIAQNHMKSKQKDYYSAEEDFLYELVELVDNEKEYKKAVKKGFNYVVFLDYGMKKMPEIARCTTEQGVKKMINECQPEKHTVYGSLEDFIIA